MLNQKRTLWVFVLFVAVGLLLGAGSASAAEPQVGELFAKNLVESSVNIDGKTFKVTASTVIKNEEGGILRLDQIEIGSDPNSGDALFAEYVAQDNVLSSLTVGPLRE